MITEICRHEDCTGCGLCMQVCPKQAITMQFDSEGFPYPVINSNLCIECNLCAKRCVANNEPEKNHELYEYYLGWNSDDTERKTGSSGGIFYALAKKMIEDGGLVAGARFLGPHRLEHVLISKEEDIEPLCGSKYIPSEAYKVYPEIKKVLNQGRKVLFVGTPCQVDALYRYCGKHPLLYTCDLICYGVGSMAVWNAYIDRLQQMYHSECRNIYFRKSIYGTKNSTFLVEFDNGKKHKSFFYISEFGIPFSQKLIGRISCYNCHYTTRDRMGDITLGDYTCSDFVNQKFTDLKKGTSLIRANTDKGKKLLLSLQHRLVLNPKSESFVQINSSRQKVNVESTCLRNDYMEAFLSKGYDAILERMPRVSLKQRLWYRFYNYIARLKNLLS